jgi:hypothetical protein
MLLFEKMILCQPKNQIIGLTAVFSILSPKVQKN